MLLVLVALVAGVAVGLALGGRLSRLAEVRLRSLGLLFSGAVCELIGSLWAAGWFGNVVLVAGYALLVGFAVRNVALTGMVLVAVGLTANLTVVAVNGGMPVRGLAAGVSSGPRHHGERPHDHLTGLGDVVALRPIDETVSAGDIVLALGVATAIAGSMRVPRRRSRLTSALQ